jgi:F0F1-type ATP synthase assembly protein I
LHDEEERKEEVNLPPIPELPNAPKLNPNLPPLPREKEDPEAKQYRQMGIAYTLPVALITPIILLTAAGWWLDQRFHRSPLFTMGGALLGIVTGFINMIRLANRLNE